jgi:PAS domain S-box-containing protein
MCWGNSPHRNKSNIYEDREGTLWFGTEGDGLFRYERATDQFIRLNDRDHPRFFSHTSISKIYQDRDGFLWLGTKSQGLYQLDKATQKLMRYQHDPGNPASLSDDNIRAILEDSSGSLWFGTLAGLNKFDKRTGVFAHLKHEPGNHKTPSSDRISAIHEDQTGTLWIATSFGGLNRYDRHTGIFTYFTEREGLPNNQVYDILEDEQGHLWLSTDRGLARFNPTTQSFRNYDVNDGLTHQEFNHKAAFKSVNGEMYFGGFDGFVRFIPKDFTDSQFVPPIYLTGIRILEQPFKHAPNIVELKEINLSWRDYVVSFDFAALDFTDPTRLQYQWKLEGLDENWINGGTRRTATYTNLAGGNYVLRVKATNSDGVWNEQGLAIKLSVTTAPWKTWWAWTLYLGALAGLGVVVYRRRTRQLYARLEQERLVTERLRQVDKLKDEFLANTSHELRTPLNGIIGLAESLAAGAAGQVNQQQASNLSLITASGKRLAALVNDILDFSKLRHHDLQLQLQAVDLRSLTDVVLALSRPLAAGKALTLANEIATDLPLVSADENRLQQILYNLVGNAIKFTSVGSVTVSAQVVENIGSVPGAGATGLIRDASVDKRPVAPAPGTDPNTLSMIEVTVADTGIGIPADKHEIIFASFEQVDAATTRQYGGAGLGLAVTRQLVELHGGRIRVESEPGQGARFSFTLPLSNAVSGQSPALSSLLPTADPDQTWTTNQAPLTTGNGQPTTGASILVVDDEPINIQVLHNHLMLEHYTVIPTLNGHDALAALDAAGTKPDLVLLDVMMPVMSGFEVCERIRRKYSADELPVIILTAKNQVADLVVGLASGANDYLAKPISRDELLSRIRTHLGLAQASRELREARDTLDLKVRQRTEELRTANTQLQGANEQLSELNQQLSELNQQLGRANENMLAVLDQLRAGVVMAGADGRVTFLSQAAELLFDRTQAEALGRRWAELFPLSMEEQARLQALAALPSAQRHKLPVNFRAESGRRYWMEIEVQDDPRHPQGKIFFLYDVSEVYDLRRLLDEKARFHDLIGESTAMRLVFKQARDVAQTDTTVLLEGETGTGKELLARAIHYSGSRKSQPFIALNCAGLTESLLNSQLFGHKRGAFTGAIADQIGVFEAASGGTLFLDEIGDIPLTVQTALLRVLQEREITRLGENKPRKVDVRIITATHRDLNQRVARGEFREDFLYRIRVARIKLPPLRQRLEDVPLLVSWLLGQFRASFGREQLEISTEAMDCLLSYLWPGNVRELRSAIEAAVIQCRGTVIQPGDLPPEIFGRLANIQPGSAITGTDDRQRLLQALKQTSGNRAAAARLLGISRPTLYRRLKELGLDENETS